ncbi:MAG: alkaline phosphatase D family protein [Burkholderiaceae bacterium]|jgi:hypothetical protein
MNSVVPEILMGPVLQYRGVETTSGERQIGLLVVTAHAVLAPTLSATVAISPATRMADIPAAHPLYTVWQFLLTVPTKQATVNYQIGGLSFEFTTPLADVPLRMAYGSCNGFSSLKLMKEVAYKNERWTHLRGEHQKDPYHLLLLGGDQIYSDAIWDTIEPLQHWSELPIEERIAADWTTELEILCDRYFADLYVQRWSQPEVAALLARIPTIMMWDDHDIIDGWGSYPAALHNCAYFQAIFRLATKYFRLLQQQLRADGRHPCQIDTTKALNLGFEPLGGVGILALDLRSERQPEPNQIVSPASWNAIYGWLDRLKRNYARSPALRHLIVMSSVPVAYLDLNGLEKILNFFDGQQSLEDDLRDHWRSRVHQQERLRLIHRLLDFAHESGVRVTIVSGDVHVAALSVIESGRKPTPDRSNTINQLISSGIVHPPPPSIVRWALQQFCMAPDTIDHNIRAVMMDLAGKNRALLASRNWLALEVDDTARIWAKWHIEGEQDPAIKVIHPC